MSKTLLGVMSIIELAKPKIRVIHPIVLNKNPSAAAPSMTTPIIAVTTTSDPSTNDVSIKSNELL